MTISSSQEINLNKVLLFTIAAIVLFIGLILSAGGFESSIEDTNSQASLIKVSAQEFSNEITEDGAIILDIRTPAEYNSGRIEGSQNIDFYAADFRANLAQLDKDQPYKIYCNSGNRSATALQIMEDMGFTDVVELRGGIQAWNQVQFPTCTQC